MASRFAVACVLFAAMVVGAIAQTGSRANAPSWEWIEDRKHEVTIGGDSGWTIKEYQDIGGLNVGDSVIFNWAGSHTVTLMRRKNCNFDGSSELAATEDVTETFLGFNPPVDTTFKFTFTEPGSYVFADSVGNNCQQGMLFTCWVRS